MNRIKQTEKLLESCLVLLEKKGHLKDAAEMWKEYIDIIKVSERKNNIYKITCGN